MLSTIYADAYTKSDAQNNVSSIAFAGTVIGQLVFGYLSDTWSRKNALLVSTCILILFAALCAGSYGAGGSTQGLFAALTAFRFFLGIGCVHSSFPRRVMEKDEQGSDPDGPTMPHSLSMSSD